jgi:predicted MPP superfamily phosphohydrolase
MCVYERIGLIAFITVLAIVYAPTLVILGRRAAMAVAARRQAAPMPKVAWWEKCILSVAVVGAVLIAYGYFVEPYWVEVTHRTIVSPKLCNFDRPIRFVLISDLHCDPVARLESDLPSLIAAEKPDAIVFTGDSVNSREGVAVFRRCLKALSGIAPTYAVLGNHDSRCWENLDLFKGTHVTALNGATEKLSVDGQNIYISGVAFDCEALMDKALSMVPHGAFTVFLYHSPDLVNELAQRSVDLVCAGHTHGGQVCLPFYGAIITQSKYGKQFEAGLYKVNQTWMYVNRGIGMEGGVDPRVRFLARPEVTVLDLQPPAHISANLLQAHPH